MKRGLTLLLGIGCLLGLSSCHLFWDVVSSGESEGGNSSQTDSSLTEESSKSPSLSSPVLEYGPLEIHFLELGNANTGDSVYIQAGDNDILIDAGSRKNSASAIESYLDPLVEDGKLEYVFATHAHQDHIAGFVGNSSSSAPGGRDGILYHYEIGNIIDFAYYDDGGSAVYDNAEPLPSSNDATAIYEDYREAREYAIGNGASWQTVKELFASGDEVYTIDLGEGVYLDILYTYFYDHTSADLKGLNADFTKSGFSAQNDCSVCLLLRQGEHSFLFTGDAEEYCEYSLATTHDLPEVDLFKAGHHGSYTASGELLLSEIKPDIVCVCCCAGNQEYASNPKHSFPAQEAIDRIAEYTDRVYVTSLGSWEDSSHVEPLNGTIKVTSSLQTGIEVECSHSNDVLKLQPWFKENRDCPSQWASGEENASFRLKRRL